VLRLIISANCSLLSNTLSHYDRYDDSLEQMNTIRSNMVVEILCQTFA